MRHAIRLRRLAAALLLLTLLVPAIAGATESDTPPTPEDSRVGLVAAIACGLFTRASVLLPHPLVIAGAVATCAYTLLDGFGDPDMPAGGR